MRRNFPFLFEIPLHPLHFSRFSAMRVPTRLSLQRPQFFGLLPTRKLAILFQLVLKISFPVRSEEHTSELQSLMRRSYAVFCLKKKTYSDTLNHTHIID